MPAYNATRFLFNRVRRNTPYMPARQISPVPLRATATPAEVEAMRKAGVPPLKIEAFEREGAAYPETLPQFVQTSVNIDDTLGSIIAGGRVSIAELELAKSTAADKFELLIQTSIPTVFELFRFAVEINGQSFIQQQFFTQPFQRLKKFFRKMDTETTIAVVMSLRPGAILVPPLGSITTQLYIDAYQGKFRG